MIYWPLSSFCLFQTFLCTLQGQCITVFKITGNRLCLSLVIPHHVALALTIHALHFPNMQNGDKSSTYVIVITERPTCAIS